MTHSLDHINQMSQREFLSCFGHIFEETPLVAQQAWLARPFENIADLHQKMVAVVTDHMPLEEKLALIQAHPELGARQKMADASVQEQASAGLSQLNPDDYQRIQALNTTYKEKFGFPFVVAVKGLTVKDIIAEMEERIQLEKDMEISRSLLEIYKIARFRLEDLVEDTV
ncbi:MAG: 2-oxo-4-hydroxy-4-carboxy-5-ureidoimidazoline decarboxylase [Cyanobacteria bacterium P01_A01_bin.116]